ncbi:MAG: N-6 DNA methylase [Pseudomonadota bacterium]|nr:N-6 DNA methylase [Pseudomonadota bacterium]
MARSTVHYADKETNNILKKLHNKLRPAGTPVQRVEYIIELLLLRIFEVKLVQDPDFTQLRAAFTGYNETLLFSSLLGLPNEQILPKLNSRFFPFYARILSEARKVWRGNLSTKVQDQLVLIEEVFSNSNFTNNVTSGNMGEIIGLVAELDSERLLKTDLLGDAIESALSETGGTKDIGLHRTPDHIRHFMVGLVAPTFHSRLFDPAVGTGGFMFDSFEYVLEGIYREGHWPGPKAHPELAAWFKDWFERHPVAVPSIEVNTDFYRTGVGGIEYLGMVRKMAAINFYVRGLNPGNIQQGDALEKFGSEILPASKSIVLANPPFGAQRDKESYPNVWSEYSTESETTILFVKLMLETLQPGGVCAVIVSEGFLTWDQNSARSLRRSLLEDCNLQAIISLPQGLFVSKGGQGPKTSILLFVKGQATERVWFYKVANDGYTMGTNRKPQAGCQLVEALDLFHGYVRQGKEPPESRHSFCIPADWIKALDPRIKDRIRAETRADMAAKQAEDRAKQIKKWDAQCAAKKLTVAENNLRLKQHGELWFSKTENEIARKIERAHLYSFNLPNYRSSLTPAQLESWRAFAARRVREGGKDNGLESRYRAIAAARPEELDELLSTLEPRHTLELDWARQFLAGVPPEEFQKHPHLGTLQEIIASQRKTPRAPLGELLKLRRAVLAQQNYHGETDIVGKIRFADGKLFMREDRVAETNLQWTEKGDLIISKINFHQGATTINEIGRVLASLDYLIYMPDLTVVHPYFLFYMLRHTGFISILSANKPGGVKGRSQPEYIEAQSIPLPPLGEQEKIAVSLGAASQLICGIDQIRSAWRLEVPTRADWPLIELSEITLDSMYGSSQKADYGDSGYPMLRIGNIGFCNFNLVDIKRAELNESDFRKYNLEEGDFLIVRSNGNPALVGKCAVWNGVGDYVFASYLIRFRFDRSLANPHYVMFYLMSPEGRALLNPTAGGGTYNISASTFRTVKIPLPSLDEQDHIVAALDKKLALQSELLSMRDEAQKRIRDTLDRIWQF